MDAHSNDNNSDVEDLDFIDFDEDIELRLEEETFDEKSDTEDIVIVNIEEQVVENSVQLQRLPSVIFKDENGRRHVAEDSGPSSIEQGSQKSVEGVIYECRRCSKFYRKKSFCLLHKQNRFKRIISWQDLINPR